MAVSQSFASLILILVVATTKASSTQSIFQLVNNGTGPTRLGPPWQDRSQVSCIVSCMNVYASCRSVLYNPNTGLCTPASDLSGTAPPPGPFEGDLYVQVVNGDPEILLGWCNTSQGFGYQSYGTASSCIGLFNNHVTFTEYVSACPSKGSQTVQVKSTDKLQILQNISNGSDFWIGCYENNGYFWYGTPEPLSPTILTQIFPAGEINKTLSTKCCQYCPHNRTAVIVECTRTAPYSCEQSYTQL